MKKTKYLDQLVLIENFITEEEAKKIFLIN